MGEGSYFLIFFPPVTVHYCWTISWTITLPSRDPQLGVQLGDGAIAPFHRGARLGAGPNLPEGSSARLRGQNITHTHTHTHADTYRHRHTHTEPPTPTPRPRSGEPQALTHTYTDTHTHTHTQLPPPPVPGQAEPPGSRISPCHLFPAGAQRVSPRASLPLKGPFAGS